jgi:ABC-type sugar transport system substrate-binding protein
LWLLGSPDHLTLPPVLHAIGVASAMLVSVRLLLRAVSRRGATAAAMSSARAQACRRSPAAAAKAGVPDSPGQGAPPFRPARRAGITADDPEKWERFSDKIMREQIASMAQASRHGL